MARGATSSQHIDLLLIGKTGHGKSATGNTILGEEKFELSDFGESSALEIAVGWTKIDETTVNVVDGLDLVDTRKDEKGERIKAEEKLRSVFVHCPEGFHALLFVLCYGVRYTKEEEKTLNILRTMLGPDFVKNHCILVFTHGENYEMNRKNRGKPFSDWVKEQTGDLGELIKECDNRAVLFYNLLDEKREETIGELLALVNKIDKMYTHDMFRKLKEERNNFIQSNDAIQLEEDIQSDINLPKSTLEHTAGEPNKKVRDPPLDRRKGIRAIGNKLKSLFKK